MLDKVRYFLATLVALHFTPVTESVGRSFEQEQLRGLQACCPRKLIFFFQLRQKLFRLPCITQSTFSVFTQPILGNVTTCIRNIICVSSVKNPLRYYAPESTVCFFHSAHFTNVTTLTLDHYYQFHCYSPYFHQAHQFHYKIQTVDTTAKCHLQYLINLSDQTFLGKPEERFWLIAVVQVMKEQ